MSRTLECFVPMPETTTTCIVRTRIEYGSVPYGVSTTAKHLAYLSRPGTAQDGGQAPLFDAEGLVSAEARATFIRHCGHDPWQFRWILSPESAEALDLPAYVCLVMRQVMTDLGTPLSWVAAAHYNTNDPHVHVVVRPRALTGVSHRISRDYLSYGLRARATLWADLCRR
jgi:type IV secretory pathway VirD2 relaxase